MSSSTIPVACAEQVCCCSTSCRRMPCKAAFVPLEISVPRADECHARLCLFHWRFPFLVPSSELSGEDALWSPSTCRWVRFDVHLLANGCLELVESHHESGVRSHPFSLASSHLGHATPRPPRATAHASRTHARSTAHRPSHTHTVATSTPSAPLFVQAKTVSRC